MLNWTRLAIACFTCTMLLGVRTISHAQDPFRESSKALRADNRLLAVEAMRKAVKEQPQFESMLGQYLPLISDYSTHAPFEKTVAAKTRNEDYVKQVKENLGQQTRQDAIQAIIELAQDRQIVILNEAHDSPQHRAFGHQLAKALRESGFEYMAMETLAGNLGRSGPMKFDHPTMATGHYSAEPVFGDFVRQTSNMGYQMIAYEIEPGQRNADPSDQYASIMQRENAQSDNLIKHVIEADKDSRLFVFVGYAHATENWRTLPDGRELGWMAAQIKKKTDIDPLTIDQVGGSYNPKASEVDPVFRLIHKHQPIAQPSVVKQEANGWLTSDGYHGKVDLTVFHPVQKMVDGRPDWLRMQGYRKPHAVKNNELFVRNPTLVQAYLESEGSDGLPVDQLLLDSADGDSTFLLPTGKYRIRSQTTDGKSVARGSIEIK